MNEQHKGKLSPVRCRLMRTVFVVAMLLACGLAHVARAQEDWAQWRGPARDGTVPAKNTPGSWPKSVNRVWRVESGEGYSSPVIANGRAFVHSRRDPEEIVSALGLADGKILWQQKYAAPFQKNQYAVK